MHRYDAHMRQIIIKLKEGINMSKGKKTAQRKRAMKRRQMEREERLKQLKKEHRQLKKEMWITRIIVWLIMIAIIGIPTLIGFVLVKFFEVHMLVAVWIGLVLACVLTFIACKIIKRL